MTGRILLTGVTGFVGPAFARRLRAQASGGLVFAARRRPPLQRDAGAAVTDHWHAIGALDGDTNWDAALSDVDVVVHAAGLAHVVDVARAAELETFRRVNAEATEHLARRAAACGVRRLVFVSSIKVNGERTGSAPFTADDVPAPEGAYAVSKYEAEQALWRVAHETGLDVVVVRPPLVYGPGIKGNLRALAHAVARGWPLPLGRVRNQRTLVGLDNLADLVALCARHPRAAGQVFLAGDGEDLSTPQLIRHLALALGRPARLLPVPTGLLRAAAVLTGRPGAFERLCGDLRLDLGKTRDQLGWTPPCSVEDEMRRLAATLHTS